jgi:hypothetical protein
MYRALISLPETSDAEYHISPDHGRCNLCWTIGAILHINKSGILLLNICQNCVSRMAELFVDGLES